MREALHKRALVAGVKSMKGISQCSIFLTIGSFGALGYSTHFVFYVVKDGQMGKWATFQTSSEQCVGAYSVFHSLRLLCC